MLKEFLKDSAIYGTASMFVRAIQLALVPLYTRVLAPNDYGSVDLMAVTASVAMSVLSLEVAQGMARAFGDAKGPEQRVGYASTALWFTVGSAALLVLVAIFGAETFGPLILGEGTAAVFRMSALAIASQLIFNLLLVQLRYDLRPKMYGLATVLYTLVSNVVAVTLVVGADTGVIGVFIGQLVGYWTAGTVAGLASRRAYRLAFDRARAREMIAFSAPLVFSVIGGHVAMLTDRVAIGAYMGLWEVGVYGIGARMASTVGMLLSAFAAALTPLVLSRYREPETPAHIARLYRIFLLVTLPILIGLSVFAGEIIRLLTTEDYYAAADVIPLLCLAVMFSGMAIFTPGMELARKTRLLAIIMVGAGFANVGLNILLIPRYGVNGSALATLLSAASGFTAYFIGSQRYYRVPHRWRRLLAAALLAAGAVGAGQLVNRAALGLWPGIAAKAGIWLVACGALAGVLLERQDIAILRKRLGRVSAASPPPG